MLITKEICLSQALFACLREERKECKFSLLVLHANGGNKSSLIIINATNGSLE